MKLLSREVRNLINFH